MGCEKIAEYWRNVTCYTVFDMPVRRKKTAKPVAKSRSHLFALSTSRTRSTSEKLADLLTDSFGTIGFFTLNAAVFFGWLVWNSGWIPALPVFDPYPFGMLTMVVSLEAIFLSVIVLISQNRAAKIADLREEVDLQVNIAAEQEVTQILRMIERIEKKLLVKEADAATITRMKEVLDLVDLEKKVVQELKR